MTQLFVIRHNVTLKPFEFQYSDFGFAQVPGDEHLNKNVFSVHFLRDVTGSCFYLTPLHLS